MAATCRYYGISRQCYYGWLRRYEADGLEGLKDRSQRPHHSPRATQAEVVEKIVWLRKHYHFGPAKIAMYLARYHDVTNPTESTPRSSTDSSKAKSSTTPTCSPTVCKSGRTTTTTTVLTAL